MYNIEDLNRIGYGRVNSERMLRTAKEYVDRTVLDVESPQIRISVDQLYNGDLLVRSVRSPTQFNNPTYMILPCDHLDLIQEKVIKMRNKMNGRFELIVDEDAYNLTASIYDN